MYSIDLSKITLDEFKRIMLSSQLLPSQRLILSDIEENIEKLKDKDIFNIQELHNLLKKRNDYPAISESMHIDKDYLVILNRMVNSFIVKELPLPKIKVFTEDELQALANEGIKNTKHYYETYINPENKKKSNISPEKLEYALRIIDLLRMNGVGVDFAKTLYDMGIKSTSDYNKTTSDKILKSFKEFNKNSSLTRATLGITDIDYGRRFSEMLDNDCD